MLMNSYQNKVGGRNSDFRRDEHTFPNRRIEDWRLHGLADGVQQHVDVLRPLLVRRVGPQEDAGQKALKTWPKTLTEGH